MILSWPIVAPTQTISIPNSALGDTELHGSNAVIRDNRNHETRSVRDTDWPITILKSFSIKTMNRTQRNNLETFLISSSADRIYLTDHDGVTWLGVITSPIIEIITVKDDCSYDASFDFMGEVVS